MYKVVIKATVFAGLVLSLAAVASWAGPPPNPIASDNGNTAGGTNALINNEKGDNNTAFGDDALEAIRRASSTLLSDSTLLRATLPASKILPAEPADFATNSTGSNNAAVGF